MERQPSEWKKIIATDKGLISKIYKYLTQLNARNTNKHNQKVRKRHKEKCLQRIHTDGYQTHEKMLNIAHYQRNANQNHNEVSSHTGQNGHHRKSTNAGKGVEKSEPSYTVGGNANQYSPYGEQCGDFLKCCKQNCLMTQQSHCWACTLWKPELKKTRVPQCSSEHC